MKKLLLLMTALLGLGVSGAWATDGSITLSKSDVDFQRNDGSGLNINYTTYYTKAFASNKSPLIKVWQGGGNIQTSSWGLYTNTYTLSMLPGYTITGYVITVTPDANQTIVVGHGTADVTSLTASTKSTVTVTGVNQNSTTFQFKNNGGDGLNKIESLVVNYSYDSAPTMVQTMSDLACADYSTCMTYNIISARSTFYAETDGSTMVTTNNVATPVEANKKFAFIKNATTGKYYLYHVASGKFVNNDKSLTTAASNAVSLYCSFDNTYPHYIDLGGANKYANIRISNDVYRVDWDNYTTADDGNKFKIEPQTTADLTRAYKLINGWTATYHIDGTSFSATADLTYNATLALPNTLKRAYCTYKFYSDAECKSEITTANDVYDDIYVKYNYTGPFAFSTEGVSPEYVYYLLRTYEDKYLYSDGSSIGITTTQNTADAYQWAIVGNPYSYTIKNKSTGTYLVASLSHNGEATLGATGTSFGLYTNTQASVTNHFTAVTTNGNNLVIPQRHPNAGTGIRCYNGTGANFTDVTGLNNLAGAFFVPFAVVTYNLIWNESTIQSETKGSIIGTASEDEKPWTVPAYSSFAYDVATIGKTTSAVNVTLNWDGPFTISSDFSTATWYYLALNDKWARNHDNKWTAPALESDIASVKGTDGALWAFMGNPYDGIIITLKEKREYNESLLEEHLSSYSSNPDLYDGIESTEKWTVKEISATTFTLNCANKYLIDNSNRMNFKTTDLEGDEGTFSVRSYYCQKALDDLADYAEENAVGQYFGVRQNGVDNVQAWILSVPKLTSSDYSTYFSDFPNNIPLVLKNGLSTYYPASGKFYRIKNNGTGNYLAYGTPSTSSDTRPAGLIATSTSNDAASVFKLTGSNGTYTLSVQGLNIQSQTEANTAFPGTKDDGVDFVFNVSSPGIVSITNAASSVNENNDGSLHEATVDWVIHGVVNWSASEDNSKWVVEDAESITIPLTPATDNEGTHTYATLCVPFNITGLTGANSKEVKAYAPTKSGDYIVPGEGATTIAAGTPVILIGEDGDATSVTANIGLTYAASPVTSDVVLTGTFAGTSIDCTAATGTNYVLGFDPDNSNRIGFYHVNNAAFDLKANRAYLKLDGSGNPTHVKGFAINFGEIADGIKAIDNTSITHDGPIFNLAGQRISKLQRGVNIVKGKKVIVK